MIGKGTGTAGRGGVLHSVSRCHAKKADGTACRAWSMIDKRVCAKHSRKLKHTARGQVCVWCGQRIDKRFVAHRGCEL